MADGSTPPDAPPTRIRIRRPRQHDWRITVVGTDKRQKTHRQEHYARAATLGDALDALPDEDEDRMTKDDIVYLQLTVERL